VLIAIGNSGNRALAREAERLLTDRSSFVRGAAVWALSLLLGREEFGALAAKAMSAETDEGVREEWQCASQHAAALQPRP